MYVLECIPIARSAHKETLSYLSKEKISPGSIVEAPLRKQIVPALVLLCTDAKDIKSSIRTSDFALRRTQHTSTHAVLATSFVKAVSKTAEHFALYPGQAFSHLTPKHVLTTECKKAKWLDVAQKKKRGAFILQAPDKERVSQYKKLIRESFNKKRSVFICVPSIQDGEHIYDFLRKGIEEYVLLLHGSISKKKLLESWIYALETQHPIVVIGTPMFLSLPRTDMATIIVEKESSDAYRTVSNPRVDTRTFIEYLAQEQNSTLIYGDSLLRLSILYRFKAKKLEALEKPIFRSITPAHTTLFDMTEENSSLVFHEHTHKLIQLTKENNEHTFVFAARKGLAPLTVCQDCGHIVTASDGSAPMVLYEHPEGNYFYSPHTKEKRPADTTCSYCGSWRLKPLGLGIDTIEKEVKKIAPDTKILRLDKDSVTSHKKALAVVEEFYNTPGAILIGTEFASSYLREIDHCIITTIDSLLSLPDFQIQEKTLRTLLSFREKALKNFVIQTRNPNQQVFTYAIDGNIEEMLTKELESREKFSFPPFSALIKITLQGPEEVINTHAQEIITYLGGLEADIYPAHISKLRGSHILNILCRVDPTTWPDHVLVEKLRALQKQYRVQVQPENIL